MISYKEHLNLLAHYVNGLSECFKKDINFFHDKDDAFVAMIVPFLQPLNFQEREPIYKKHDHPNASIFHPKNSILYHMWKGFLR